MEDLFSGGFTYIIIGFVVLSIITSVLRSRAAKKKKAQDQQAQEGQAGQQSQSPPVRQTGMSDIQKAFAMMAGVGDAAQKPAAPPQPKPDAVYGEGFRGRTEGRASHEGTHGGHSEGRGGRTEGRASHEGTRSAFAGEHSMPHEGPHKHEGSRGRTEGTASLEGTHGLGPGVAAGKAAARQPITASKYESVKFDSYLADDRGDAAEMVVQRRNRQLDSLNLFEGKDELTKAIIYSEILKRKSAK